MVYPANARMPEPRPLVTLRPRSSRSRARNLKPEMKHALQLMNKEIHQRLKACRGQNRRDHPLLPSMDISREIGPIMESPSDAGASSPERCATATAPPSPEAMPCGSAAASEVSWRQRLRHRGWRLPERSWTPVRGAPGAGLAAPEALNTTLKLSRKAATESLSARSVAGSAATSTEPETKEPRPARSAPRARRRASNKGMTEAEFMGLLAEGEHSTPPTRSRRTSAVEAIHRPSLASGTTRPLQARQRLSQAPLNRRMSAGPRREISGRSETEDEEAEDKKEVDDSTTQGRATNDRTTTGNQPNHLQAFGIQVEIKEVDITFQVVKNSTQRQESPASDLEKSSGWWESAPGSVEHQFIVLQTQNKEPKMVHALELSLPGNDAGPRSCKLQYCTESPEGPWQDAWSFQVQSKTDVKCRTTFETGTTLTKDFKEWLARTYRGNSHEGWRHLFSENETQIPCEDFVAALGRIRQHMFNPNQPSPAWCSTEAQKLCDDLGPEDGQVTLASVLSPSPPPPEAAWWKLIILTNWGSPKRLQVMSPLRLTTLIQVQTGGLSRMRASFIENQAGSLAGDSLIRAFDLDTLGVDSEAVQLRRLAKKYGLSILDVEDMHRLFSTTTSDGKVIVQSEFISMLLKLYGTDDLSDLPPQRLKFFWQQADQDGSGEIDFEEFIMWYNCYCEEILSRRKTRGRRRESVEEDTRSETKAQK